MSKDFLRAYPAYAPYQDALREIFEKLPEAFAARFPHLAQSWEPYLRSLFDREFDIDSIRKAASDNRDFQQWLPDKNLVLADIPRSFVDEFICDVRGRFRKRNTHPMDPRAALDIRGAIKSFLAFAAHQNRPCPKSPGPGAAS